MVPSGNKLVVVGVSRTLRPPALWPLSVSSRRRNGAKSSAVRVSALQSGFFRELLIGSCFGDRLGTAPCTSHEAKGYQRDTYRELPRLSRGGVEE